MALPMSVFDTAPTILHIYGLPAGSQMTGRVLTEIFQSTSVDRELSANQ